MAFTSSYTNGLIQQSEFYYGTPDVSLSGSFSGSFEGDGSNLINVSLPSGVVSGSAQISYTGITNVPSDIISSSAQIASDISGSFATDSASFSTRITTNETDISTLTAATASYILASQTSSMTVLSSSFAVSASYAPSADAFPFTGDAQITGSLNISGSSTPLLSLPDAPKTAMVISGSNDGTRLRIYDTEDNTSPVYTEGAGIVLTGGEGSAQAILEMSAVGSTNGGSNNEQTFIRSSEMLTITGNSAAAGDNIKLLGSSNYGLKLDASTSAVSLQFFTNGGSTVSTLELGNGTYTKADASGTYYKIGRSSTDWLNLSSTQATFNRHVSSSAISTASFGTYLGDGSQLTGISSGGGTSTMIASGSTSASADPGTGIVVNHSGSTAFSVIGDVGTLFSVDDSLTGTLFSANDISGFPILQADSTGEVYIGKSPQSLYTTAVVSSTNANESHSLCTLSTSSYDGGFFEYTAHSASNARAGNIMSTWNGSNIVYAETTTMDIGDTSDLTTEVIISGSTARLIAYSPNASYKIKTIIKAI